MSFARCVPGSASRRPDADRTGGRRQGRHAPRGMHRQPSLLHRSLFRSSDGSPGNPRVVEVQDVQIPSAAGAGPGRGEKEALIYSNVGVFSWILFLCFDTSVHDSFILKFCTEWNSILSALSKPGVKRSALCGHKYVFGSKMLLRCTVINVLLEISPIFPNLVKLNYILSKK